MCVCMLFHVKCFVFMVLCLLAKIFVKNDAGDLSAFTAKFAQEDDIFEDYPLFVFEYIVSCGVCLFIVVFT